MNLEELEHEYYCLTIYLKGMSGKESDYGEIWDKRVDIVNKMNELKKINSNDKTN